METDDKGGQHGAWMNKYMISKNVQSNSGCMTSDILQHCEMPSKSTVQNKKYLTIDAGCGVENISCISKDEGPKAHRGENYHKILTGSSSSVDSFFPTEYKEQIDIQSSKHSCGGSATIEGDYRLKSSHLCDQKPLKLPAGLSDNSDPSETSSFRDEHAGAISLKADLSSSRATDLIQNAQNFEHKNAGSIEPHDHLIVAAFFDGSDKNANVEDPSSIKEPSKNQMLENNEGADELVDVPVCDICGDVGRERLLVLCSNCSDGAEHTYCMRIKRDELPGGDWMCEECTEKAHPHKMLVDNEGGNSVEAPPSGTGHDSGEICVDSSKVAATPSCLGKRVGSDMLANSSNKKRVLSGSLGFYAQRVVVSSRNRGTALRTTRVASSPKNVSKRMQFPVTASQSKDTLIKSSGLKVDPQDDGSCTKKFIAGESVDAKVRKEHIPEKLRKCESFRISRPVYSDTLDSEDALNNDLKYQNKGVKSKIAQRSHSFDFKNSHPVLPVSPGKVTRAKTDKIAPGITEVKQAVVPVKGDLDPEGTGVHRALVRPTPEKALGKIVRNTGSRLNILNTYPAKDRRSTIPGKNSSSSGKTDDIEVEEGALKETTVQLDNKTKFQVDRLPSACFSYPAAFPLNFVWRGIFKIEGATKLPLQCRKLQGHVSGSISPTVFDMVSKWPCEITLKEVLKRDVYPDQIQTCGTTGTDTRVYFFAEDIESYRPIYKKFLNCMARNNLALQSNLDGVELLVIPSHYLPNKVRRWNKRFYMCGVLKENNSSCLNDNKSVANPQKGFQKPEPGLQSPYPGLTGHGSGSVSAIEAEALHVPIQGNESTGKSEVKSIPDEVDAKSTDGRSPSGDMLDYTGHKKEFQQQSLNNNDQHALSGIENPMHPAADRSSCSNNFGFSRSGEYLLKAGSLHPQERYSSPLDALLHAVEFIENSKTNQGSFSVDSDHCKKDNSWADQEVQPSEKPSVHYPVNLELSLWSKDKPEKGHELDLLSGLANSKDGQFEHGGNYDGGRRFYNVSLDLSLALP